MVNSEAKTADLSLLSDGSSPINSTGNTPDSAETLDSSESSLEKRVAKEIKLKRGGKCSLLIFFSNLMLIFSFFYFPFCCPVFFAFVWKAFCRILSVEI